MLQYHLSIEKYVSQLRFDCSCSDIQLGEYTTSNPELYDQRCYTLLYNRSKCHITVSIKTHLQYKVVTDG